MTGATPALTVEGVWRSFGGVMAVNGCSFTVADNSITGLVGPNGAGKSTMINLISGLLKPERGSVHLRDRDITGLPMEKISNAGLIRTFQVAREWPRLTVLENVLAAAPAGNREGVWRAVLARRALRREDIALEERARGILDRLRLTPVADKPASALSGGQKRLLEFARISMVAPQMVLLDEPLAGVNPVLGEELGVAIQTMRSSGSTVLLIEHNLGFIERLCDSVVVMATGAVIGRGSMSDLRRNPEVLSAYLGQA
jgi:ABC-type branched-subunit amino acid transport system ATPase component